MKLGILTSIETRHRYFANALRAGFDVVAIGYEEVGYRPAAVSTAGLSAEEAEIFERHFSERDCQEQRYFGHDSAFVNSDGRCRIRHIPPGTLNTDETLAFLRGGGPTGEARSDPVDAVAVYGTSLIKAPLLGCWPGRMLNLHLGLSPYYRGTATNFYPLLYDEPEYVGATVHLIDAGVDSGPILRHARPDIVGDDTPHTIGCKAILAGTAAMIRVLGELDAGTITPVPQWHVPDARVCLRKDYHPRQVIELYSRIDEGMIPRYVDRAPRVAGRVRLVL